MNYPPAYPHDALQEIADEVFMIRGSIKMNPLVRISRNMAAIRRHGELTLVNPIRLSEEGEKELTGLGSIDRILRLGPMHGLDDRYYVDRFHAELWTRPGGTIYPDPPATKEIDETVDLGISGTRLFCFENCLLPEAALLVTGEPGLLLTCDAIQHYGDFSNNNFPARTLLPLIGFSKTTLIGPPWLKLATPEGGSLRSEFERLLELPFDRLLSAHGTHLENGAHAAVARAVANAFDK